MSRTKEQEKFSIVKAVKANARERLGSPSATKIILDKTKLKKPKYKPDFINEDEK